MDEVNWFEHAGMTAQSCWHTASFPCYYPMLFCIQEVKPHSKLKAKSAQRRKSLRSTVKVAAGIRGHSVLTLWCFHRDFLWDTVNKVMPTCGTKKTQIVLDSVRVGLCQNVQTVGNWAIDQTGLVYLLLPHSSSSDSAAPEWNIVGAHEWEISCTTINHNCVTSHFPFSH